MDTRFRHRCRLRVTTVVLVALACLLSAPSYASVNVTTLEDGDPLGTHVTWLEDASGELNLEQIETMTREGKFQTSETEIPTFGYSQSAYWFHLQLLNDSNHAVKRLFQVGYALLDNVNLFTQCGELRTDFESGDTLNFASRPVQHRTFLFPVELAPNTVCNFWLRVETTSSMQVPMALWETVALFEADQVKMASIMVMGGVLGIMAIYNLFILFSVRRRVYFYYVGFVSSALFLIMALSGTTFQFFWPNSPWLADHSLSLFIPATGYFATMFTLEFLSLNPGQTRYRVWPNRILRGLALTFLILAVAGLFIPYYMVIKPILICALAGICVAVVFGTQAWREGAREGFFYTISWFAFLVGAAAMVLAKFGILPTSFFTDNAMPIGSGLQVALLSFALADQLKTMERAKAQAERHAGELQQNLSAALESKLYIFSSVAHELNNPLNYMSLSSESIRRVAENLGSHITAIFDGVEKTQEVREVEAAFAHEFGKHKSSLANLQIGVQKVATVVSEMRGLTRVDGDSWHPISLMESLEHAIERLHDALDPERINATPTHYSLNGCADYSCRVNPYLVVHAVRLVLLDAFDPSRIGNPEKIEFHAAEHVEGVKLEVRVTHSSKEPESTQEEREPVRVARQLLSEIGGRLDMRHHSSEVALDVYELELDFRSPDFAL